MSLKKYGMIRNGIVQSSFFKDDSLSLNQVKAICPDIASFLREIDDTVMDNFIDNDDGTFTDPNENPPEQMRSEEQQQIDLLLSKLVEKGVFKSEDITDIAAAVAADEAVSP